MRMLARRAVGGYDLPMGWAHAYRRWRCAVLCVALLGISAPGRAADDACGKADFEAVVEEAATGLRDLNTENKPKFQDRLRQLKTKRGWTHGQFMQEAAPFVMDDKITQYDQSIEELLGAIASWWIKETRCRNIWQAR